MSKPEKLKIVVLISGNGSNLQAIIDAITNNQLDAKICCVISNKKDAFGIERAKKANIACHIIEHQQYDSRENFDAQLMQEIDTYTPDVIVLAGFMRILSSEFIEHYPNKIINIHPSLLPKHKGLNTHQRALDAGDNYHGLTIHYVNNELDSGPIIEQVKVAIDPQDNAQTLAAKVQVEEHKTYPRVLQKLSTLKPQLNTDKENKILNIV